MITRAVIAKLSKAAGRLKKCRSAGDERIGMI